MDEVTAFGRKISDMSNEELAEKLKAFSINVGPINRATRQLYEKRLRSRMVLESAANCTIPYSIPKPEVGNDLSIEKQMPTGDIKTENDDYIGPYFGVKLPPTALKNGRCVFTKKEEALRLCKEYPGARFKQFNKRCEAEEFSLKPSETSFKINETPTKTDPQKPVPSEGSAFRGPKPAELMKLKNLIETADSKAIETLVWSNPRFLIGNGDTPTILQEGFRYNALHICASKNKADVARLIMDTVENSDFIKLMYPDDSVDSRWNRIEFLTDLYLNTPEKGNLESPLHFACKFGYIEVVDFLAKHPKIDKNIKNKYGETPADIICSRVKQPSAEIKDKIRQILEDQYYVSILRCEDNSLPARISKPWCPNSPASFVDDEALVAISPIVKSRFVDNRSTMGSPCNSPRYVKGSAGPMTQTLAEHYHKMVSPSGCTPTDRRRFAELKRGDCSKGVERICRDIAKKMNVSWCEYWDFLGCNVDISSAEGLKKLEEHLSQQRSLILAEHFIPKEADRTVMGDSSDMCNMFSKMKLSDKSNSPETSRADVLSSQSTVRPLSDINENLSTNKPKCDLAKDDDDDDDDCVSYHTAVDDLDLEYSEASDIFEDSSIPDMADVRVFIHGEEPSKTDVDVLRALDNLKVSTFEYPLVHQWIENLRNFDDDTRSRWGDINRQKQCQSTPQPHISTPKSVPQIDFGNSPELLDKSSDDSSSFESKNMSSYRRNMFLSGAFN